MAGFFSHFFARGSVTLNNFNCLETALVEHSEN